MFALGLVGFGVTSLLCGLAPSIELLIAFRVLQGAAGALLVPGSLAIITASFEGEEQGRAFGLWAGASAGTTILGPFVGGLLVESVSWRAAFLINVPFVLLALYATVRHVAESRDEQASSHFDWLGALVVLLAVGGLSFGAIIGQQENWHGALPYVSLAIGAIATIAFPILMLKSKHPLVPLGLFKSRNFTVTNISTLVIYGALYVTFQFMAIYLIGTVGFNPAATGLVGIPGTLFLVLFSSRFGKLAARYGPRIFMTVGPAIMALGILWFARAGGRHVVVELPGQGGAAEPTHRQRLTRGAAGGSGRIHRGVPYRDADLGGPPVGGSDRQCRRDPQSGRAGLDAAAQGNRGT